ncbi:hypothetical protein Pen01_40740 [Phytomonospora endophytica]|nr:hypothetical protein Pen01_40740 [Phytomonospora endophytica]
MRTATSVPVLRRLAREHYNAPDGVQFFYDAIKTGQQPIRPPGPDERVARLLAAAEANRLEQAELWFVDEDLCTLLASAWPTMPPFAPMASDLPSPYGFVVFAEPIHEVPEPEGIDFAALGFDPEIAKAHQALADIPARIVAASWGPMPPSFERPDWRAEGLERVWFSFYSETHVHTDLGTQLARGIDQLRAMRASRPPVMIDNEGIIALRPPGAPVEKYQLGGDNDPTRDTLVWARMVLGAFQLARQANLADESVERTPRPERRRAIKDGIPERDVRIIKLRSALAADRDDEAGSDSGREYRHRWVVRGHWRNHWYPSLGDHRPKWIAPYLKGPDGAPLLGGEKVHVASVPPQPRQGQTDAEAPAVES